MIPFVITMYKGSFDICPNQEWNIAVEKLDGTKQDNTVNRQYIFSTL
jgi:hypothetical protein